MICFGSGKELSVQNCMAIHIVMETFHFKTTNVDAMVPP